MELGFFRWCTPQKYDENGRVVSVLLANRDFTEEKKRELEQEEALRQEKIKAEKANEAKSIFYLICHMIFVHR